MYNKTKLILNNAHLMNEVLFTVIQSKYHKFKRKLHLTMTSR